MCSVRFTCYSGNKIKIGIKSTVLKLVLVRNSPPFLRSLKYFRYFYGSPEEKAGY